MLDVLRERSFPADEVVPSPPIRGALHLVGRPGAQVVALSEDSIRDFDVALFSAGSGERRVGAAVRRGGGGGGGQLLAVAHGRERSAGGLGGQRRRARGAPRHRRQSQLHDHADRRCARADTARGGHRARGDVELPGRVRHGPEGGGGAPHAGRGRDRGQGAAGPCRLPAPDRLQRAPQVETFKDGDDYTTEERKCMRETRKILGRDDVGVSATCARVPVFTGHSVSANVQTRSPLSPEECRQLLASLRASW